MRRIEPDFIFNTPLGWVGVAVTEQGIDRVVLPKKEKKAVERELRSSERAPLEAAGETTRPASNGVKVRSSEAYKSLNPVVLKKVMKLLQRYFLGKSVLFDVPLDLRYYTPFQQAVWRAAAAIPFGETRSYAWIAKRIRNPKAVRAVGQALGANPVPIIIP